MEPIARLTAVVLDCPDPHKLAAFYAEANAAGLFDDTLLVLTSDHGEAFGDHDLYLHDGSVWQTHLHVPLWIQHPGLGGGTIDDTVSTRDLFAVIRSVAGGEGVSGTLLDPHARAARPVAYEVKRRAGPPSRKSLASSTMIATGLWLVAFLVLHVRAFRFPTPHYETADGHLDLYRVEMETLDHPLLVAFYVVSMLMIGSHLWHGASSALQSLGLDHPRWTPRLLVLGRVASVAIAGIFIAITLWVYFVGGRQ